MLIEKASISTKGCQVDNNTNTNITKKKHNVYFNLNTSPPVFSVKKETSNSSNTIKHHPVSMVVNLAGFFDAKEHQDLCTCNGPFGP